MPNLRTITHPIHASENSRQWVSISDENLPSYLSSARRSNAVLLSRQLMASSGLYQRLVWAIVDEIVPPTIQLAYSGENMMSLRNQLDWIWKTGPSPLLIHARSLVSTFFVEGELLLTPRINSGDGRVTVTNVSPDKISALTKGEGISTVTSILLDGMKPAMTSSPPPDPASKQGGMPNVDSLASGQDRPFTVIRPDPNGTLTGDIFYFRLFPAGLTLGLRGSPLLMSLLDDAASATELMYGRITRLSRAATHYWDVQLTGAPQETIDDFLSTNRATPPESGEVFAHNEQATWKYVKGEVETLSPELLFVINYLAGVAGLAPEFIGHTASRDITTEALFSAISHLQALQSDVLAFLESIITFSAQRAAALSNIILTPDDKIHIVAREVGSRLVQRQAQAFSNFISGIEKSINLKLMTPEQGQATVQLLLTRSGLLVPAQPTTRLAVIQ